MPEEKPTRKRKAATPKPSTRPSLMPAGTTPDSYWSLGIEQYNPDSVVKANGLKIYREMRRRDPVIALGLDYLETARLSRPAVLEPGEGARGEEIADFVRHVFDEMEGTDRALCHDLLDALPMGYAVVEKVWRVIDSGEWAGKWGYECFRAKWQESIDLRVDEYGELTGLKYKGMVEGKYGAVIEGDDLDSFIVFVPNRRMGNWYGESVLRPVYRVYTIKDHLSRYLAVHMEKFGSGVYELGTNALPGDRTTIVDDLKKMHGSSVVVHGADETFQIHYPPPGVGDGLVSAIEYCNSEILRGLGVPQTLFAGTGSSGQGGSLALSETHERTFGETVDRIGRSLEDVIDEKVIWPLVEYNFPNVQPDEVPHYRFEAYAAEDGMKALERMKLAKDMGAAILLDDIYDSAGTERPPEDAKEEDVVGGKQDQPEQLQLPFDQPQPPPIQRGPMPPEEKGRAQFAEAVREINEWERKVNFAEIERGVEGIVGAFLDEATKLSAEIRDAALEVVDEKVGKAA